MKRRSFLSNAAKATLALAAAPLQNYEQLFGKPAKEREWGIQLYTLRSVLPAELKAVIKELSLMGYKKIEGYTSEKGHYFGIPANRIKSLMEENGMQFLSEHVPLGYEESYKKEGAVASLNYGLETLIESAKTIGQSYFVIPNLPEKAIMDQSNWPQVIEMIKNAAQKTIGEGIQIAYHNHEKEFIKQGEKCFLEYLLENTQMEELCFELDVYWAVKAGQLPEKWLATYPKRFQLMHIKDMYSKQEPTTVPIGKGSINYKEIIKVCDKLGLQHFFYEQDNLQGKWQDAAAASLETLKTIIR